MSGTQSTVLNSTATRTPVRSLWRHCLAETFAAGGIKHVASAPCTWESEEQSSVYRCTQGQRKKSDGECATRTSYALSFEKHRDGNCPKKPSAFSPAPQMRSSEAFWCEEEWRGIWGRSDTNLCVVLFCFCFVLILHRGAYDQCYTTTTTDRVVPSQRANNTIRQMWRHFFIVRTPFSTHLLQ